MNVLHAARSATPIHTAVTSKPLSRRTFLRGAAGVAAFALLTTGCTALAQSAQTTGTASKPFQAEVAVSHFKSLMPMMAWTYGLDKGIYQAAGLEQNFTEYDGGGDTIRGLLNAGSHYGMATPSAAIAAFLHGEPVRVIGGGFGASTTVFVVKQESPFQQIDDLKGKKIGYSKPGSASFVLATTLNTKHSLGAELVSTGGVGESLIALRNGLVDCVWTAEPQPSRFPTELRRLVSGEEIIPHYAELVMVSHEQFVQERPDILTRVAAAYNQSMHAVVAQPAEAAASWAKIAEIEPQIVLDATQHVPSAAWTANLPAAGLRVIEQTMLDLELIDQAVDWGRLVVQDFLPAENRASF